MLEKIAVGRRWMLAILAALLFAAAAGIFFWHQKKQAGPPFALSVPIPGDDVGLSSALYQGLGVSLRGGHELELLNNGSVFDALERDIRAAQRSVNVVMYIWEKSAASDRISAALVERARAKVACRILVDDLGSPDFGENVQPALREAGCEVRVFRPQPASGDMLARNHRKIVVVDGQIGFVGGFGIRDSWLGDGVTAESWREASVRFVGPAVREAQQAFAENWQEAGGALLPQDDFVAAATSAGASAAFVASTISPVLTRAERFHQMVIQASNKRLWIANAYFVPSEALLEMIKRKAAEGIDVRLLVPGKQSDSKTSFGAQHIQYGSLLEVGVRVWEYQPSMMHAKTIVVDDDIAVVGSMNLDPLTLGKLEESALLVKDAAFATQLARSFEEDCTHAEPVTKR